MPRITALRAESHVLRVERLLPDGRSVSQAIYAAAKP
jgi:hypothetical protein